jgi:hypothetical protein
LHKVTGHYAPDIGTSEHAAYSSDLAPSDFCPFPNLKKHLDGRKFSSAEEAKLAAEM